MKKVVYSITRLGKTENTKITGVGLIAEDELITIQVSKKTGKPYFRTYDCVRNMVQVIDKQDEYRGSYYEIGEYEGREYEINYLIWYTTNLKDKEVR